MSGYAKKIQNYIMEMDYKQILGEGQYGQVYPGYQIGNNEIVAIKMIATKNDYKTQLEEMFAKEVKVMQGLDHPNLVKFMHSLKTEKNLYIIMEYCEGGTLNEYISQKCKKENIKYLAESEARIILREILKGYKYLYDKKIVHRDLKPSNILMKRGKPKISDFGFGKILENFETDVLKTLAGTPRYMSPQLLNYSQYTQLQYTSKTDIWSLGVIFYEILFGVPPRDGNLEQMRNNVKQNQQLTFPNNHPVSKEMREIISKMLQYDEKDRMSWEELFKLQYFIDEEYRKTIQESLIKIKNEQNEFIRKNQERILYIQNYGQNIEHARQQQQEIEQAYPKILNHQSDEEISLNKVQYISFESQEYNKNKIVYKEISDWINHKRNKSLFLNNLIKQIFELSQNRQLKQDIHMDFVVGFTITKYQILILYKIYNRLQKKSLEGAKKFKEEEWKLYCKTEDYIIAYQTIKNDYDLIKSLLIDYIKPTTNSLKELNNPILNEVLEICNMQLVIKQKMNSIFDTVTAYFFQKVKSQVNINELSLEYLQFLVNLKNCSKIHSEFKFNNRFDFFKYNDNLMNQTKEDLINILK